MKNPLKRLLKQEDPLLKLGLKDALLLPPNEKRDDIEIIANHLMTMAQKLKNGEQYNRETLTEIFDQWATLLLMTKWEYENNLIKAKEHEK